MRILWFPSSTTAGLLSEDQRKDMHSRCWEADKHTPEGRQTHTDVSGQGHRQTQSSLEHRNRFQTLFGLSCSNWGLQFYKWFEPLKIPHNCVLEWSIIFKKRYKTLQWSASLLQTKVYGILQHLSDSVLDMNGDLYRDGWRRETHIRRLMSL